MGQLDFHYNRNMTGEFPAALASIPQLADLMIHDTNLTSTVPLPNAWPAIQDLIVSGTGGLCGPIPSVCSNEKVCCDVHTNFLPCEEAASKSTEGDPCYGDAPEGQANAQ